MCSRATVMAEGRLRFDGTPAELRRRSRFFRSIELHLEGSPEGAQGALEGLEGVASVEALSASTFRVFPQDKRALLPQKGRAASATVAAASAPKGYPPSEAASRARHGAPAPRRSGKSAADGKESGTWRPRLRPAFGRDARQQYRRTSFRKRHWRSRPGASSPPAPPGREICGCFRPDSGRRPRHSQRPCRFSAAR